MSEKLTAEQAARACLQVVQDEQGWEEAAHHYWLTRIRAGMAPIIQRAIDASPPPSPDIKERAKQVAEDYIDRVIGNDANYKTASMKTSLGALIADAFASEPPEKKPAKAQK